MDSENTFEQNKSNDIRDDPSNTVELHYNEKLGKNIFMITDENNNRSWKVIDEGNYIISEAPIKYSIPCLGYVINEKSISGNIDIELVKLILMRNKEALGLQNLMEL